MVQAVMVRNDMEEDESQMEVEELLAKLINAGVVEFEK
jgi:Na+-translocating ferredoxin:NAD+ oxidoreductase RnfC subunit